MVDLGDSLRYDDLVSEVLRETSEYCPPGRCHDCDRYRNGAEPSRSSALLKDPVATCEEGLAARKSDSLISRNIKDLVSPMVWVE